MRKQSIFIVACIALSFFLHREAQAGYILHRPLYLGLNSGLVGYWSFDGSTMSGTSVADRSG